LIECTKIGSRDFSYKNYPTLSVAQIQTCEYLFIIIFKNPMLKSD
jgi:hypothetical protein